MDARYAESVDRVLFEVELDHDHRFLADDPAVMSRLDRENLWGFVLDDAAVGIFDVDLAADEEPDMRVHAEGGSHDWLHVHRPSESRRVDHALHPRLPRPSDFE